MAKVFLLGATGYIGGSLLVSLSKAYPDIVFTALVRSESDFSAIRAAGATPVHGSFSDHGLIADLSAAADIVLNAADSDDVALLNAILRGLRRRKEEGRGVGAFIHTSGGMIFMDDKRDGRYDPSLKIWTDSEEDIRSLKTTMYHGQVDIPLMKASEEGYVNSFIVCPVIVYGRGSGPVKQDPLLFRYILLNKQISERKEMLFVGEGSNVNNVVHIDDLVEAYHLIFRTAHAAGSALLPSSPYSRYYIVSAAQVNWKTLASLLAIALHKRGIVKSSVPVSVAYENAGSTAMLMSSNMNTLAKRLLDLSWKPQHVELSENTFHDDVDAALK